MSAQNTDKVYADIASVDQEIIRLVRERIGYTRELTGSQPASGSEFPASFQLNEVVERFRAELGDPAELLARSILVVCRAALRED